MQYKFLEMNISLFRVFSNNTIRNCIYLKDHIKSYVMQYLDSLRPQFVIKTPNSLNEFLCQSNHRVHVRENC